MQEAGLTEEQVYVVADAIRSSEMPVRIAFIKAAAARRFTADYYHLKVRLEGGVAGRQQLPRESGMTEMGSQMERGTCVYHSTSI